MAPDMEKLGLEKALGEKFLRSWSSGTIERETHESEC
jgi:hypothetical protein